MATKTKEIVLSRNPDKLSPTTNLEAARGND